MSDYQDRVVAQLFHQNYITENQYTDFKTYKSLGIFSLHNELRLLLYLSVLLFTSGVGMLVYQNIDRIGHIAILTALFLVTVICFYFCIKKAPSFQKEATAFSEPLYDYLLLAANLLACSFIGYLQFQFQVFGTYYQIATLLPTLISLFCAYYFDNKTILTLGLTGLAAFFGLSVSPASFLNGNLLEQSSLSYSGILLGIGLVFWNIYAHKINLKSHFKVVFLNFALHLISIGLVVNLFEPYWYVYLLLLALSSYYFYQTSIRLSEIAIYVFAIIYAYIGINVLIFKILDLIDLEKLVSLLTILFPIYIVASIIAFVRLIKQFKSKK